MNGANADDLRELDRLVGVVRRLRGPDGCPWDREQTLDSLKPHLVEECYELVDAIESGDPDRHCEELGDVLLHILLQARIRAEEGSFTIGQVATALSEKLIRRHPHVFGETQVSGTGEVLRNWEAIKAGEKAGKDGASSIFDGVPRRLPALHKAQRVQTRAARVGFDWPEVRDVCAKVEEELAETQQTIGDGDPDKIGEEVGDLLFAVVNLSRFCGVNAEEALQQAVGKFIRRFREVEHKVRGQNRALEDCSLAEMDAYWEEAKQRERAAPDG